ncbi:integrase core domain-containing protein [Mesomycoplasma ovipneumoniae]|uniref:integrase core domain-containing protein n=1 Tax=Mesomycoplasma ovipneumoniae TaxID=29562 RepID=UPI00311B31B8
MILPTLNYWNKIQLPLNFSISKTRFSEETINLVKETIKSIILNQNFSIHHGVEYANYKFLIFKANVSNNQFTKEIPCKPSYWIFLCVFQRELINIEGQNFENVATAYQKISSFIDWYNYERPQSCLSYKTPSYYMR